MQRALGLFVAIAVLASVTWGANCDLRCSLGLPSSCAHGVQGKAAGVYTHKPKANSEAMPAGHCERMAQMSQAQEPTHTGIVGIDKLIGPATCPRVSCSIASALVCQVKKVQFAAVSLRTIAALRFALPDGEFLPCNITSPVAALWPPLIQLRI
jgi:hypothetical protein